MKITKNIIAFTMAIITIANFFALGNTQIYAHNAMLEVTYDDCIDSRFEDGIDETWYSLDNNSVSRHIGHEEQTIKYYYEPLSESEIDAWNIDISENTIDEIKAAYANSMKKWNNVYFYSYDSAGNVIKNKIINIVEGTASDHNLSIYLHDISNNLAETNYVGNSETIENEGIEHVHYSEWMMNVYVNAFYIHDNYTAAYVNAARERTGAHEFGHILGLRDVDSYCSANAQPDHHQELLMGYGETMGSRAQNISYKDIAGVAITRGFHTDNDHKWLNRGLQSNGKYNLLCSICNGVKEVSSLSGYTYDTYASCGNNHALSSGNMMAVASYGTQDYYKCKYCRYVAPFSSIVSQNYTVSYSSSTHHKYVNNVSGLNYTFYEEHMTTNNGCFTCGYLHTHSYGPYVYNDNSSHIKICICGSSEIEEHYVKRSDIVNNRYASCLGCGRLLDLLEDTARIDATNATQVSINGSYILPSGIVVLEDADIEAYLNGTLQFYNVNDNTVTE